MPYVEPARVTPEIRRPLYELSAALSRQTHPGLLNYVITRILDEWLYYRGVSYENLNTVHGVLSCVDKELYRRVTAPYENMKRHQNGDVYLSADDEFEYPYEGRTDEPEATA